MITYNVSEKKEKALLDKMERLCIYEKDIVEKFVRSSGKGGQNVNKTSTCVYLKHIPTKIEVKCQKERFQALNRYIARKILVDKIEAMMLGKESEKQQRIEKIRRQKRKRSKRAKLKMLDEKKKHSRKKTDRRFRPSPEDLS
ncbi:MAG: peptide chain release factor-like protein [Acidobacteriota bacterium]|nr:peptide chain release factor-like protein [Acidobacteriota bacterium]